MIYEYYWQVEQSRVLEQVVFSYPIVGDISLTTATLVSITADQMSAAIPSTYDGTYYVVTINFIAE